MYEYQMVHSVGLSALLHRRLMVVLASATMVTQEAQYLLKPQNGESSFLAGMIHFVRFHSMYKAPT